MIEVKRRICPECRKPIILKPSPEERARTLGGTPEFYLNLFTIHPDCLALKRKRETSELIKEHYANYRK